METRMTSRREWLRLSLGAGAALALDPRRLDADVLRRAGVLAGASASAASRVVGVRPTHKPVRRQAIRGT